MQNDLFCEDYYQPPNPNIIKIIEQLEAWRRNHLTLYPNDVINMLIDAGLISVTDVRRIFDSVQDKSLPVQLPNNNIT